MDQTTQSAVDRQVNEIELIERAQRGDRQSLNNLAQVARERLRTYVYRLTQKDDLAQEIVQESLLEMCKILGKLQKTDRFWPWLYGIATNKLHRHYRTEKAMKHAAASEERRRGTVQEREEGFEGLVGDELKSIVAGAMQKLRTRHKAVLVMRCYDGMAYSEIAESMGCSEFSTRMLFVRAKKALQKELLSHGFSRGSLLAALIVFGKMTAPSKAAAAQLTVPAAVLKAGLAASVAGLASSTTGIVTVAAVGALTVGTVVTTSGPARQVGFGDRPLVPGNRIVSPYATATSAHEQYWYYFPEGPDGSLILRAQSRNGASTVLQNGEANYAYQGNTVTINNHRMLLDDLSVFKLPTDSPTMRGFLAQVEGIRNDIQPVSAKKGRGLLAVVERKTDDAAVDTPWTISSSNVLDTDYFQSDWPTDARIVDNRDAMHRRGWTYFRIQGTVGGRKVAGAGRVPFVYAVSKEHRPWLRLTVGDLVVVDSGSAATLQNAQGESSFKYRQGSFFRGLSRPWMGLHAVDTVRRDAAAQRARFETQLTADGRQAQVTVTSDKTELVYTIDIEADLVRRIDFIVADVPAGSLEFEYLSDVNVSRSEFAVPSSRPLQATFREDPGILWLVALANGTLGGQ
ncbi:MAG TPA: RNA polymerase sigma factor [Sedimentisphaerales bacterium]|nr:RNA polymerase sigma factor [Sedimentisphaerales bacterium]HNU28435.1 RNA polymerase sigma factor [Sedimentisphaerales bacterium]